MRIFISYRRDDSRDVCGRIYDRLVREFTDVRWDRESLLPGLDYEAELNSHVEDCDVCLVIIGPKWADACKDGVRRVFRDDDIVRMEIRMALRRRIPVIPVLVNRASLPLPEQLPDDLHTLLRRQCVEIQPDPDFHSSLDRLIEGLRKLASRRGGVRTDNAGPSTSTADAIEGLGLKIVSESPRKRMMLLPGQTVGIDLGTTFSAIARLDAHGLPVSIPNVDGKAITPSVVLLGEDGHVIVGPSVERMAIEDPSRIVEAVKRQMGNTSYYVPYQNAKLGAEFLSALILKKLKQDAEQRIGPIVNAVITVPYYFNERRREATRTAGQLAGLNVIEILNEPTAATLAYAWNRGEVGRSELEGKERTVLVYDLGGGTFDVAVVRYTPTKFRVLATDGDVMLGGIDWTMRIVDHVAEQFKQKFGADPREDNERLRALEQECEDAKRMLSLKAQVPVTCYHRGKTLTVALTRGDFERMTADLMQRTRDTTELVLQQARIRNLELDDVILVGGSTYMPWVESMLTELCGRQPSRDLAPEVAVAQGAAVHAAILEARETREEQRLALSVWKRLRTVTLEDVNSHSLGIKVRVPDVPRQYRNHIMIPKNTPIPAKVQGEFATASDNQQRIHIYVLEGEGSDPECCTLIGDIVIADLPQNFPAGTPIEVTYSYDSSGRLSVEARETQFNRKVSADFDRGRLSDPDWLNDCRNLIQHYEVE